MNFAVSPGVERVEARAVVLAAVRGEESPTVADWLVALLEDDEAKPAEIALAMGAELDAIRVRLAKVTTPAASASQLYTVARQKGLLLRADASVTTDLLFLAALGIGDLLADLGLSAAAVEARLAAATAQLPDVPLAEAEFYVAEPTELLNAARIVDVNANRARESLRVLDDFARFIRNDAVLTEEVKRLRHDLVHAVSQLPPGLLAAARDTPGDVGTAVSLSSEYERVTATQVARVNLARLQESLRSLEEYGKILDATFARRVEAIRYAAYTLDRSLFAAGDPVDRLHRAKLYALLGPTTCVASLEWTIAEAAEGGVDVVQLRDKSLGDRELLAVARDVRRWTRAAGVLFVVNDRPDIAVLCQADGVHLGQEDVSVADARRITGGEMLLGVSTHIPEQVRAAIRDGATYLGVGPTFPSSTKSFDAFPGLEFVREVAGLTTLPAFALGGIDVSNVGQVVAAGLNRVAVSRAIAGRRAEGDGDAVAGRIEPMRNGVRDPGQCRGLTDSR